jgi:hypothetical protein
MRPIMMCVAIAAGMSMALQGCAPENTNSAKSLEGAWELVDAKYTPADPTFSLSTYRQIKILTKTHWAFLSQQRTAPKLSNGSDAELLAAAKTFGAGGGTYQLDGDTYTEHVEFFATPNFVGASLKFKIKWEGDEWIQTGTLPIKALGLGDKDLELYERYRRIK